MASGNIIDPVTGLAPEATGPDVNSLTQFIRALANYMQAQGAGQLGAGEATTQSAIQGVGGAQQTLAPTVDFWTKLLSGDRKVQAQAIAPTSSGITAQYAGAQRGASMLPRGGFAAGIQSSLPFMQARDVGNLFNQLQPMGAQGLQSAAQTQGSLAQLLASIGQGQTGLGAGLLGQTAGLQSTVRGQDVGEHGQAMGLAGQTANALANIIASIPKSDRRLKRDLIDTGLRAMGVPVYVYRFLRSPVWRVGVMAQDLVDVLPEAVYVGGDPRVDPWRVDYSALWRAVCRA